jgi:hypothetical protein
MPTLMTGIRFFSHDTWEKFKVQFFAKPSANALGPI